jgi:tRNA threonylcarbamoyladenosine biosynthesis protein TsaE
MKHITKSRDETINLGAKISGTLKPGDVLAIVGDLGSGKTTLVKGIAKGLCVKNSRYVNSPSFVIIKEYKGKIPLYHFDVYRLNVLSELDTLSFEEYFYSDGICVVEWADKIKKLLPKRYLEVKLKILKDNKRDISIKNV